MRLNFEDHHIIAISVLSIAGIVSAVFFIYWADRWGQEAKSDSGSQVNKKSLRADLGYQGAVIALLMVLCYLHGKVIF